MRTTSESRRRSAIAGPGRAFASSEKPEGGQRSRRAAGRDRLPTSAPSSASASTSVTSLPEGGRVAVRGRHHDQREDDAALGADLVEAAGEAGEVRPRPRRRRRDREGAGLHPRSAKARPPPLNIA